MFKRERLRKTSRELLHQHGIKTTRRPSGEGSLSPSPSASPSQRGHQRSFSDGATTATTSTAKSTNGSSLNHHKYSSSSSSPKKCAKIKRDIVIVGSQFSSSSSPSVLPEAYVLHRPIAEGFLDIEMLSIHAQPLFVTVPLQTSSWTHAAQLIFCVNTFKSFDFFPTSKLKFLPFFCFVTRKLKFDLFISIDFLCLGHF